MSKKKNIAIFTVVLLVLIGAGLIGVLMTGAYKVAMGTVAAPVETTRKVTVSNTTGPSSSEASPPPTAPLGRPPSSAALGCFRLPTPREHDGSPAPPRCPPPPAALGCFRSREDDG